MLSFAPKGDTNGKLSFTWYENGEWMFRRFSDKTQFEVNRSGDRINYELLLSWQDVYPIHPWLSEAIGFNINFSKAFGDTGLAIYANKAEVGAPEPGMSDHLPMNFEPPGLVKSGQTYLILERNHLQQGEKLRLRSVTTATDNTEGRMAVTVAQAGGANLLEKSFTIQAQPPPGTNTFTMDTSMLEPADYQLTWESFAGKSSGEIEFTVLPQFNEEHLVSRLAKLSGKISYGSVATMEFNLESILQKKSDLRTSDNCPDLRQKMEGLFEDLESAENGYDPLAAKRGYVRRAFRSEIDGTLQPYTVRIPGNYDKAKSYAAIVFLHGSDSDDTAVERHEYYLAKSDVLVIAPNGRGPRTAYTVDNAQEDIGEAIADALENYNIDEDRLVLAGFSMGGYGAYRTFYETPARYKGVAVFSGHPSLAEEYFPGMGYPDFLKETYLAKFSGSNFIIFHGRKDRNTQFELTDEFVEKLRDAGVGVKYFIDENVGHRPPKDKGILESYDRWLADTVE
jgi:predicted esterase